MRASQTAYAVVLNRPRSFDMRIAQSALVFLLLATAPSESFAQIVIPYKDADNRHTAGRLDHAVPVATVIRSTDSAIALPDPEEGDGFVLGAAKLDLKDPEHPMVAFIITNAAQTPMPLSTVWVKEVRVNSRAEDGHIVMGCSTGPWLGTPGRGDTALQPGATISVEMPIAPRCPALGETVGFLVYLHSDGRAWVQAEYETLDARNAAYPNRVGPDPEAVEESAFLHRAWAKLLSLQQH
jgi:hypothetical protein